MPADLEIDIADALRKGELVVDPIVSVTVAEYMSRQVTLVGALKNPGTIQAMAGLRLLDAIARAGGLAEDAGAEILVRTRESADTSQEKRILVKSLIDRQDDRANLELHGGEEIRVPRAPRILIMGSVRKQGALVLVDSVDSTVLKAVAISEGLAPFASKTAFILRPKADSTEREQIEVPLAKILDRKSPDVRLLADDIFYVPDNKTQRISAGIVDRLVSFGSATTSGVLIWRK